VILFPAIDLKNGACVRLWQGRMERATVFNTDPAAQARAFADQGCQWLHLVDLDGAVQGRPVNADAVEAILEAVEVPVQLGGGIRDMAGVEAWLEKGVRRVILGTAALRNPSLVDEACRAFPGRIVASIDATGGRVAVEGWGEVSETTVADLARRIEELTLARDRLAPGAALGGSVGEVVAQESLRGRGGRSVAALVYTDIERDGTMRGLNVAATAELARGLTVPVIASGGVASLADLEALKEVEDTGIEGVIVGRALYDDRLDLAAALEAVKG
jgi:phosphoribosylformimino-5-aminoimidazole carboxamide ribotide isomerase